MNHFFFRFSFILLLSWISTDTLCAGGVDTLIQYGQNALTMHGRVYRSQGQQREGEKMPLDSAIVSVVNEGGKTIWYGFTDSKGRLNIKLPLGKKFTMSFSKKGFVKKFFNVDTHVNQDDKKDFDFTYDIDIFEAVNGLDVSVLNSPVAKVVYKSFDKTFTYDVAYTNKTNAGLQKMYREYYALKKKESNYNAADSAGTKPATINSNGPKKSVPYGQGKKPHQ